MANSLVYHLRDKKISGADKNTLGGKGFYLKEMQMAVADIGAKIPNASILTTDLWKEYKINPNKTTEKIKVEIIPSVIKYLSATTKDKKFPLVSVRSGSPVSMPGMMDTILNLGINSSNVEEFAKKFGRDFAYNCYTRFLTMFGEIALEIKKDSFRHLRDKKYKTVKEIDDDFETIYKKNKKTFPDGNVEEHLLVAILSVLNSWDNERAKIYRKINKIPEDIGTAIVIQQMVFGNRNNNSATGVCFSRNPSTGKGLLTGEFLTKAQGEDVVAGIKTPDDLDDMEGNFKEAYTELKTIVQKLEKIYKEVQDVEFTIDDGELYILQARTAKRTPLASLKFAIDFYKEGLITNPREIFNKFSKVDYLTLNNKQVDPSYRVAPHGIGLSASTGVLVGKVVFNLDGCDRVEGKKILLATETTPDDMPILQNVDGIVTSIGGVTSHAAVVARSMNKTCIVGSEDLVVSINKDKKMSARIGVKEVFEGDTITIEAENGRIWVSNDVPIIEADKNPLLSKLEDLVFEAYPLVRITSSVDDIDSNFETIYSTWPLDEADANFIEQELHDACEYTRGVIDMEGKFDYLQKKYNNQIPFIEDLSKRRFKEKLDILLEYTGENKSNFKVFLGKYHNEFGSKVESQGFKLLEPNLMYFDIEFKTEKPKNNKKFFHIVGELNEKLLIAAETNKNVAISGKRAILSLLK